MRIVIDLQGAQSESRFRGIGRYSLALALGVARNAGQHEVWLVLNAALPSAIEDLRAQFAGLVPPERIRVFDIPPHCAEQELANGPRARAGELLREHFIAQLRPDAVLVTSLFEGYVDDAVVSVGRLADGASTAVVLYDLIPFLNPQAYLGQPAQRPYYERKIESLRKAGLLLAISDYSRQEAIDALGLAPERVVAISTAVDDTFQPGAPDAEQLAALRRRFGIEREVLMYAPGGFDARKNIDGLITAFSLLPPELRARHQLLVASKMSDKERVKMEDHARACGVGSKELIFTGYVSDEELVTLYRSAALFVFPSKHEGFGLPALEAMACGAIVIGADATSVPEVIGTPDALFDPLQPAAIAAKMAQVLQDEALQQRLRAHGQLQRRKFSWDQSARKAIAALEARHVRALAEQQAQDAALLAAGAMPAGVPKRRVAFVSPMLPERTGVADYSTRILPTLLPWFEVEIVVQQPEVTLPPELQQLPVRDCAWLRAHAHEYDHIVYQFGNSPFHSHMMDLLREHPGVVVLHDFYLSSMISYEQLTGNMPGVWTRALLHSHGYAAVRDSVAPDGYEAARQAYPSNLEILHDASHVIVHSDYARTLAQQWYGPQAGRDWSYAQLPRAVPAEHDRAAARQALGLAADDFVVANFGFVAPTKHCLELLQAWVDSSLHGDRQCRLVFVGENHGGEYGEQMTAAIKAAGSGRITISGWTSDEDYLRYLQAADVAVQLRTSSRGETSGTVLDCMIYGLPTLINANGAMAEFPTDAVWMLPDRFSQQELVAALDTLRHDGERRAALGRAAFALMGTRNSPQRCGWLYRQALERDLASQRSGRRALLQALLAVPGLALDEAGLRQLSRCAARAPDPLQQRQLLVDVTAIARHDLKTGIERVVRHQLLELLQLPHDSGWRAEAVYLSEEGGVPHFRYARRYVAGLLGIGNVLQGEDPPLDIQAGDAFYSADHEQRATMAAARAGIFADWRARGLSVNFLVHDLLPVLRPEFFPPHADITHDAWLRCVAGEADRLICVSRAVADELDAWLRQEQVARRPSLALEVLHHGADLGPAPQQLQPQQDSELLRQVAARPSFLMVGTIEPRKGHLQALDAFEQLWADGVDVNLVIVGSEGWKPLAEHERRTIPRIMQRLRKHPQLGQRLLHPAGVDDATLQQIYLASACLLSPSEGEGFGLPLIEAASYGLPLLLRDIPVFREVAGERAAYFSGSTGQDLAAAVRQWLAQHGAGSHPQPHGMPSRSWRDNVAQLLSLLEQPLHRAAPARPPQRQLLVDVTNIARHDLKTGIERVVRHQLLELLQLPPDSGWRAEAVYLSEEGGVPHYRYAHRYVAALLGAGEVRQGEDPPLEVLAGDAYYCADHSPHTAMTAARAGIFAGWRARGISLSFVVYDLLPVLRPDFFPAGADATHADWLRCLAAEADRLVCISQAVADELRGWLEREQAACRPGLEITASHLGADIGAPPQQLEQQQDSDLLRQIAARPSFLMVATIEPRKGHLQTLDAFEQLWAEGVDVNLVLVGKEGWQPLAEHERRTIPQIMARLQQHPELGKRLLRPSAVDDATLQQIYLASSCLLSPSEGEGFGLPLIEAASYGLPLLLRDIPVFREVAGERAAYFSGTTGQDLAAAVRQWLAQHGAGRHPQPQGMPWRTWRDNVAHLLSLLEQPKEQPC